MNVPKLILLILIFTASLLAQQCKGTTKKGTQCKRKADSGSVYCWQHTGATEAKPTNAKQTEAKSQNTAGRCQATTKKGTQCKRKASADSKFCWQHG